MNKVTPLHNAAYRGFSECVTLLLSKGASVDAKDQSGDTPLHFASAGGHTHVVQILVEVRSILHC